MTEPTKTEKPGFVDSLASLLDSAQQLAQSIPGALREVAPLLPKELQAKVSAGPTVLPKEIAITFRKLGDEWGPVQLLGEETEEKNGFGGSPAQTGDMVGRYVLVSETPWGEPAPEADKPA
jgi:hypothetical protein